jgi:diguanylate cyclase (GGDEF)-like protein/PAS domain S-box-containing protein
MADGSITLRSVTDSLTVGVIVGDSDGSARLANRAWLDISGQYRQEWLGRGWLNVLATEQRERELNDLLGAIGRRGEYRSVWQCTRPDGRELWLRVTARPELDGTDPAGFVATVYDETDERIRSERLAYAATHDPLSGLVNRAQFLEFARIAVHRYRRSSIQKSAIVFVDVDGLKAVNDEAGHDAGDYLLVAAARCLERAVRPSDTVGRFGGDEFVVLCDDLRVTDDAATIAQRIIDAAHAISTDDLQLSLSVGVAFIDSADEEPEIVIQRADRAMYCAKQIGRGHYSIADSQRVPRRRMLSDAGTLAIAAHELSNSLTVVVGLAATLRDKRDRMSPEQVSIAFDAFARHAGRMVAVFESIVGPGRGDAEAYASLQPVELQSAVNEVLQAAPPPESTKVTIVGDLSLVARSRPTSLNRVLVNLLTNAYRYGGPNIVVKICSRDGQAFVEVRDDGPGVADEYVPRLFDPFTRGGNGNQPPGSGLGLAIARELARSTDGDLTYEAGQPGSRFLIRLALANATSTQSA